MAVEVRILQPADYEVWDAYLTSHPQASVYHQPGWYRAIQQSYGHQIYNLIAVHKGINETAVVGVLSLVHIKHFLFGNSFFSLPFADLGGVLAEDEISEKALLKKAVELTEKLRISTIELRQGYPLAKTVLSTVERFNVSGNVSQKTAKVRMLLDLPDSSKQLMDSLKSKLRSQIRRPLKDGLYAEQGGVELLNDFYTVFAENMRDLGSPVHSKTFIRKLMNEYKKSARIFVVYKEDKALACSLTLGFKKSLSNPWASSLRRYSRLSPNMLLYWAMLEYACDNGYTTFDFGRSTLDEGTYKFKKQWGATERPLCWYTLSTQSENVRVGSTDKSRFELAMRVWKKLPVPLTKFLGPSIRKNIGL